LRYCSRFPRSRNRRFAVHVEAGDPTAPFTDPQLRDSAKDLHKFLKGKKIVRLVETPSDATVVVRVVSRDTPNNRGTVITQPMPTMAVATPYNDVRVDLVLVVGEFSHPMTRTGDGVWGLAARRLAGDIDRWLKDNQAKLRC
jgi:hypothetical protein